VLPLWIAQDKGLFAKQGLTSELITFQGGTPTIQALLSGGIGFAATSTDTGANARLKGGDIVGIAEWVNSFPYMFIAAKEIDRPEKLKGKKIAISQLGAGTDFIARHAVRQLGLNEKDVTLLSIGAQGERWAALAGGHVDASVFQPPVTLRARKAGLPIWVDFSKTEYEYVVAGPVTTRSFIKTDRETVMNFMRGLADGMDFYRDEKNKDAVIKHLGEFYKSTNTEELEETRQVYRQVTPGLPIVTLRSMENMIASDRMLSTMNINGADVMDLSFLRQLEEERKIKK
jgi:NitT/TauT family transport system substrate-binding protein